MKNKTLPEITELFSFAMLLVVFGHSMIFGNFHANPDWYLFARKVIYSFHMYLFFFISGFLFIYTNIHKEELSYIQLIKIKTKRLMAPYIILLSLTYLPRVYMSKYTVGQFTFDLSSYINIFINPHYSPMYYYWFIFTLFFFFIISWPFLVFVKMKKLLLSLITTIALIFASTYNTEIEWFCLNYITGYMLYFWLGCLFYMIRERVNQLDPVPWAIILFLIVVIASSSGIYFPVYLKFLNIFIHLAGIFFSYFLMSIYTKTKSNFFLFRFMEGYTFPIYLLSFYFHEGSAFFLNKIMNLGFYAVFPVSLSTAIIFPVLIARFVEKRLPKLSFIIGL